MVRWKTISSHPSYEVSDQGSVKKKSGRPKALNSKPRGYVTAGFYEGGRVRYTLVHHLVAEAFVANPDGHKGVEHIDGDLSNNHAENLRWVGRKVIRPGGNRRAALRSQWAEELGALDTRGAGEVSPALSDGELLDILADLG